MRLLTPLAAIALAACATATQPLPPRTVAPDYVVGGGSFNTGTHVIVAAETFREAGKVGVCAAWAAENVTAMTRPYFDNVLGIGVLQLGGSNILQGFEAFPRAPSRAALAEAPADCVLTGRDWRPEYAGLQPEIEFGRMVLEREDESLGGVSVSFSGY